MRKIGGRDRVRTCDLVVANDALSQLSYTPTGCNFLILAEEWRDAKRGESLELTAYSLQLTVSEEEKGEEQYNAEAQSSQRLAEEEKREAKRDGNTEFTEIGTQRAQRREMQEREEKTREHNAETQSSQRRETQEGGEEGL